MIYFVRKWLFTATLAVFTFLFLMPQELLVGEAFNWWDKAQHALAFSILCIAGFCSHPGKTKEVFWLLIVYGGLIELLQSLSGWRQGDWLDWLADSNGVLICYGLRTLAGYSLRAKPP